MLRLATASLAGTAIEFYDFAIYGTAAALVLGPLFFPSFSPLAGTLAAFGTFGVGFLARPVGAVLFGHVGDRFGRRPVLFSSLILTGATTVAVGCLPTYDAIGLLAPVLLILLRFLQGLGLGGEWGGAVLLTAEHAPAHRRALWASFPQTGPSIGFLLANGVMLAMSAGLTDAQFTAWGWRVPFLAAGVLAVAGLLLRSSLEETPDFKELAAKDERAGAPFAEVVRDHWRLVLLTAGALSLGYALVYTMSTWSLAYGTERLGVDRTVMLGCIMAAVVLKGPLIPLAAVIGDRVGRRPMCLAGCVISVLWVFPMMALLSTGQPWLMFLGFLGGSVSFATMFSVIGAYLPELYAPRVRCTGAALGYNLAGVFGGALTPVVATAVSGGEGPPWGVAAFLTGMAVVSLGCFALLPETLPASVRAAEAKAAGAEGAAPA